MATMFPRRVFTTEDMNKTLVELELAPSASIVILQVSATSSFSLKLMCHTSNRVGILMATLA